MRVKILAVAANTALFNWKFNVGIMECAFLGVPVVNIGSRQNRRDRGK
jgi:hypothetical protein